MQTDCGRMSARTDSGQMCGSTTVSCPFCKLIFCWQANEEELVRTTRLRRLDQYVLQFLRRRSSHKCADLFALEAKVPEQQLGTRPAALLGPSAARAVAVYLTARCMHSAAIDAPEGFLHEWWGVFWELFVAKTRPASSPAAAAYLEARLDLLQQLSVGAAQGPASVLAANPRRALQGERAKRARHALLQQAQQRRARAQQQHSCRASTPLPSRSSCTCCPGSAHVALLACLSCSCTGSQHVT